MNDTSVYQRPGRPKWFVSYWCTKAMKRVHKVTPWRVDDPTGHKHATRFAAAKAQESQAFRGTAKLEVWSSWAEKYLADRYRRQAKTLKRYLNAWDWLRVFVAERDLHHPQAWNYNHVLAYLDWRTKTKRHCGRNITRNTALTEVKVLGVLFVEAIRRGFCTINPCVRLGLRRDPPAEKPEITDDEVALILELLAKREGTLPLPDRWMTISFQVALYHGVRISETAIPMTAIDLKRETVRITAKGKNGVAKVFTVKIHPAILPLLRNLHARGASQTCQLPQMASKEWHTFFQGREELRHLCFHCTRVTVITRLARAGVPISQTMAYVGHASQTVHRIYQRLRAEDLSACSAALSYPLLGA